MKRFFLYGFVVVLIVVFLQGCMSSPVKRYYQLHMEVDRAAGTPQINKIVMVSPMEVDSAYNDYRMVYRLSAYELNYYSYEFWIKKPAQMVRDSVIDYLSRGMAFKRVFTKYAEGDPDLLLRAKVNALEEYDHANAWFAHLKMVITIKNYRTDKIVLVYRIDRRKKLTEKKVGKVAIGLSVILEEELTKMVEQLALKLKSEDEGKIKKNK